MWGARSEEVSKGVVEGRTKETRREWGRVVTAADSASCPGSPPEPANGEAAKDGGIGSCSWAWWGTTKLAWGQVG